MRYEELGIVIALWHAVNFLKLLFDSLQFFDGQAMQKGAIKNPQLALEASFNHIVGVGAWHLMFTPLLSSSIVLKLPVFIYYSFEVTVKFGEPIHHSLSLVTQLG